MRLYDEVAASRSSVLSTLGLRPGEFALLTVHGPDTVDSRDSFERFLRGVDRAGDRLGLEVVYPLHPRAAEQLEQFGLALPEGIRAVGPLGFIDFLQLEGAAALAFIYSGGVQEETYILGRPCVTLRYGTERPETVYAGDNCIAGHDPADIVDAATRMRGKTGTGRSRSGTVTPPPGSLTRWRPSASPKRSESGSNPAETPGPASL